VGRPRAHVVTRLPFSTGEIKFKELVGLLQDILGEVATFKDVRDDCLSGCVSHGGWH